MKHSNQIKLTTYHTKTGTKKCCRAWCGSRCSVIQT